MRAPVALLPTLVVLVACGGGDGGDRLSRQELVAEANAICERFDTRIAGLEAPQSQEEVEQLAAEAVTIFEEAIDGIRELEPPEELEERYDEWVRLSEEQLERARSLRDAAAEGDVQEVQRLLAETNPSEARADELATELGLTTCAED
jgi:hypothetical protein